MEQSSMATVYPSPFLTLPVELGVKILSLVDQKTLLIFEQVSKSVADCVNATWHNHKGLGLKFSWSDCQKEHCPEKWELILSRALIRYIDSQTSFNNNPKYYPQLDTEWHSKAKLQQISLNYFKLKELTERFPSFGAYIRLNLAENIYANGYYPICECYAHEDFDQNEIFYIKKKIFEINKEQHDSLMNQVLKISEVHADLQTYVSVYLLARTKQRLVKYESKETHHLENYLDWCKAWAVERKSNTLQKILSNPQNLSDFNRVPANLLNDLKQKNKICKIPSEHGGELLLRALFNIKKIEEIDTKEELEKVNKYFLDAIKEQATCASQLAFNLIYDPRTSLDPAEVDRKERALLYEPLAISSAELGDSSSVVNLAHLKFRAKEWAEAESLYEDYLKKIANQCIHEIDLLRILYALTVIKVKFEKFKEIEPLFTEIYTLLLKLNQAWMNMIDIDSVPVVYKKEMKDSSAEEFLKEFGRFFFHPQIKVKQIIKQGRFSFHQRVKLKGIINFNHIKFLSDLFIAADKSGKWKRKEIILAINKNKWCSVEVLEKIQNLRIKEKKEMEKIQNKEPQSTEKELQEPASKRARYN